MGLAASVEFNYPTETPELGLPIDYSDALEEFCATFVDEAQGMAPVDTGYLRSTIDASPSGDTSAECVETCEYAQYQEYGTWCMGAQPHFEPALYSAASAAESAFASIYEEALEEEAELLEEIEQAEANSMGFGNGGRGSSGGGFGQWAMNTLAAALVAGLFTLIREIFSTSGFDSKGGSGGSGKGGEDDVGGYFISMSSS